MVNAADRVAAMRIAVLGTGTMGAPIARSLVAAGHEVHAWNRTRAKSEGLGAEAASTPAEAVSGADVVFTILADAAAIDAALPPLGSGVLWVQMSTVGVDETLRFAASHARFLDAPVLGSKPEAERGELLVFAAGAREPEGLFDAIARDVLRLGDEPGDATRLKLVVNLWIADLVESIVEAVSFAEALDVDPRLFLKAISGMAMDSPYAHAKTEKILEANYAANFSLALMLKDVRLALAAAAEAGLELPVGQVVEERFARAKELGHGSKDTAALYLAGLSSSLDSNARPGVAREREGGT
jgi:3-hydroxyisobutyrate dehydrogenase